MAIEDGVALAALLPFPTATGDVPARLRLLQDCRKARVDRIQEHTRRNGRDLNDPLHPTFSGELA